MAGSGRCGGGVCRDYGTVVRRGALQGSAFGTVRPADPADPADPGGPTDPVGQGREALRRPRSYETQADELVASGAPVDRLRLFDGPRIDLSTLPTRSHTGRLARNVLAGAA